MCWTPASKDGDDNTLYSFILLSRVDHLAEIGVPQLPNNCGNDQHLRAGINNTHTQAFALLVKHCIKTVARAAGPWLSLVVGRSIQGENGTGFGAKTAAGTVVIGLIGMLMVRMLIRVSVLMEMLMRMLVIVLIVLIVPIVRWEYCWGCQC